MNFGFCRRQIDEKKTKASDKRLIRQVFEANEINLIIKKINEIYSEYSIFVNK